MAIASFFFDFLEWVTVSGTGGPILELKLISVPLVIMTSFLPSIYTFTLCLFPKEEIRTPDQKGALSLLAMSIGLSIAFSFLFIIVLPHFLSSPLGVLGMAFDSVILMTFLFLAVMRHSFLPVEQESLRVASERIFKDMHEGVILLDDNGKAFLMNDAARNFLENDKDGVDAVHLAKMLPGYSFCRDHEAYEVSAKLQGHEKDNSDLTNSTKRRATFIRKAADTLRCFITP